MFWVNYMYFNQNYQDVFVIICADLKIVYIKDTCIVYESANVFISGIKKLFR